METRRRRAERIPEKKVKTKNKKKHRGLKIFGLIVLLIALIGGAIGGKGYLDVKKASEKSYQPIDRKTSAKLPSLKSKSPFSFLFLGVNGKTANDILVLTVNPKQNKTTVVSLNRNIYLQSEATTLKELYGTKGTAGEVDALQTLLGVEIPRYMTFDMRGLGDFVEAVGGVDVQNDTNFISSGYEFKPGTLNLKKVDEVVFLPYHRLGIPKYQGLGRVYEMGDMKSLKVKDLDYLKEYAKKYQIKITVQ